MKIILASIVLLLCSDAFAARVGPFDEQQDDGTLGWGVIFSNVPCATDECAPFAAVNAGDPVFTSDGVYFANTVAATEYPVAPEEALNRDNHSIFCHRTGLCNSMPEMAAASAPKLAGAVVCHMGLCNSAGPRDEGMAVSVGGCPDESMCGASMPAVAAAGVPENHTCGGSPLCIGGQRLEVSEAGNGTPNGTPSHITLYPQRPDVAISLPCPIWENCAVLELTDEYMERMQASTTSFTDTLFAAITFSSIAHAAEHEHETIHKGTHVHDALGHHWADIIGIEGHMVVVSFTQEHMDWINSHEHEVDEEHLEE